MSIFSWLTGNSKAADTAVQGVVNGIDAMVFTDEERSQVNLKITDLMIDFAKNTAHMSISRRVIVCVVSAVWLLLVLLLILLGVWLGGEHKSVEFLYMVLKDVVNPPFMIIVGFYFLTHVVKGARGKS